MTGYDFRGRVIVITGAAGGIGAALAHDFASRGARIAAVDRAAEELAVVVASLPGDGHAALCADLTARDDVADVVAGIRDRYGRIDVLINNAGVTSAERFDERSVESIEWELSVNLVAPLVLSRMCIDLLKASDDPRLLSTVSLGGIFPLGETPIYTASKFGLRGAMLALAMDLGAKGIRAGAVLPSATDTPMLQREAREGGNSLQFLDPPQRPADVVRAYRRMLDRPRFEAYPKRSESWLVRVVMVVPGVVPRLLPLFRGRGERGMKRYLEQLAQSEQAGEPDGMCPQAR